MPERKFDLSIQLAVPPEAYYCGRMWVGGGRLPVYIERIIHQMQSLISTKRLMTQHTYMNGIEICFALRGSSCASNECSWKQSPDDGRQMHEDRQNTGMMLNVSRPKTNKGGDRVDDGRVPKKATIAFLESPLRNLDSTPFPACS
jgi:hypothetical protein